MLSLLCSVVVSVPLACSSESSDSPLTPSGGTASSAAGSTMGGSAGAPRGGSGGSATAGTSAQAGTPGASGSGAGSGGGAAGTAGMPGTGGSGGAPTGVGESLGQFVMTWYSFQDNTPVNSAQSSSGRELHAYVSVAVPFRLLKDFGGDLDFGQKLYIAYLEGKPMPNGKSHSGWVEIDDFCGDDNDDSYCYQDLDGMKYPNTDLYIGDFAKSGMMPKDDDCSGPAGSGQELTEVSLGEPGSGFVTDYGVPSLGTGKCGDYASAEEAQFGLDGGCWHYTPPMDTAQYCEDCEIGTTCASN